jgi:hypothetical protein
MNIRSAALSLPFCLIAIASSNAESQFRRPTLVESLKDIRSNYLALKSSYRLYVIDTECIILSRENFAKILLFKILPVESDLDKVVVFIRSYRTFSVSPPDKIKVSRGGEWFLSDASGAQSTGKVSDEPYAGTIAAWNEAHSSAGTPEQVNAKLKLEWHAYATDDSKLPSTRKMDYWLTLGDFDFSHGTLTNYLIAFPPNSKSEIPFDVKLQNEVRSIELRIDSNVETLSGRYKFVIE